MRNVSCELAGPVGGEKMRFLAAVIVDLDLPGLHDVEPDCAISRGDQYVAIGMVFAVDLSAGGDLSDLRFSQDGKGNGVKSVFRHRTHYPLLSPEPGTTMNMCCACARLFPEQRDSPRFFSPARPLSPIILSRCSRCRRT